MKRKIAAILAADVVGYSRLVAEDENRALEHLLACREIFADFIERGGGRIFNTAGDAVLAEFPSAVDALLAGIDIQDCLRTHYEGQSDGYRMQFRMGITIGDVVERDGDLLGDGVNVAARLEGLAEPGGICISGVMYEQVLNKVSARFRDVGMKTVKNIPSPIHVYALAGSSVKQRPDARRRSLIRRPAPLFALTSAATIVMLLAGWNASSTWRQDKRASVLQPSPSRGDDDPHTSGVYGVVRPPTRAVLGTTPRLYAPLETPFVGDGDRQKIAAYLAVHGSNSALALSRTGAFGLIADQATVQAAREQALKLCGASYRGECGIYEVNGEILWPRPIPIPPKPWVDSTVARTPFDLARLRGISAEDAKRIGEVYPSAPAVKVLVMGPVGSWWYRSRINNEDEAMRVDLEQCGDQTGMACRVVALNDEFVVNDTSGPVQAPSSPVDRCDDLAGAPFDVGPANRKVSFAEIDPAQAVPICRAAMSLHPLDPGIAVSLARALQKGGFKPEEALELYRNAAAAGDAAALNILGTIYDKAQLGVPEDPVMAVGYFRKAADGGNPDAMRNLGLMYAAGRGVGKDPDRASQLFMRADHVEADWKPRPH